MNPKKVALWAVAGATAVAAGVVLLVRLEHWRPRIITVQGAVIRRNADPRKQLPIAGADITVSDNLAQVSTISGQTGYFKVKFREKVWPEETLNLNFRHAGYKPLDMKLKIGLHLPVDPHKLFIAKMTPVSPRRTHVARHPTMVSDVRIRYTVNYRNQKNIGSTVKVFKVVNKGGVPCKRKDLCSPNGRWKASKNSVTLDAGSGDVFRNVRASCIAGPCPFTRINQRGFEHGGQTIVASAIDWSDTATFLVEAEVFHQAIASKIRKSYPVIYGRDLHFTAPPTAEGVSIEAEIGGKQIVFPLGTDLYMSWAVCDSRKGPNHDTIYQCELKPKYTF